LVISLVFRLYTASLFCSFSFTALYSFYAETWLLLIIYLPLKKNTIYASIQFSHFSYHNFLTHIWRGTKMVRMSRKLLLLFYLIEKFLGGIRDAMHNSKLLISWWKILDMWWILYLVFTASYCNSNISTLTSNTHEISNKTEWWIWRCKILYSPTFSPSQQLSWLWCGLRNYCESIKSKQTIFQSHGLGI
jgi:hypothetical protein